MTLDERLEALAARHQALSRGIQLLFQSQRETDERIRRLAIIAEQNQKRSERLDGPEA